MKKLIKAAVTGLAALCIGFAPIQPAIAEEAKTKEPEPVKISASIDYKTKYVFRGITFLETPVMQTTVTANQGNISIIGFTNLDAQTRELTEADITLDYTKPIGKNTTLSLGYTYLGLPTTDFKKTQEVYAGLTAKTQYFDSSLFLFRDSDKGKGTYTEFSLSKEFNVGSQPVSISTALGHNDHYFRERSGFSNLELGLTAPIQVGKDVTISPRIKYSKSLCPEDFKTQLQYGVGIETRF